MNGESHSRLSRTSENISVHSIVSPSGSQEEDFDDIQTPIRSTEDDVQCTSASLCKDPNNDERGLIFVIVDANCDSNPSSKEILINKKNVFMENSLKRHKRNVIPDDIPTTSRDQTDFVLLQGQDDASTEELEMVDINLQSENNITIDEGDNETEPESIVLAYLRNKDTILDNNVYITSRKKSSILEHVPKMETIIEDKQFSSFSGQLRIRDSKESQRTVAIENKDNPD